MSMLQMPHLTPLLTSSLVTMVADGDSESFMVSRRRMECVNVSVTQPMDNVQLSISEYIWPEPGVGAGVT